MVCVDRIIASACADQTEEAPDVALEKKQKQVMVECRICQEEDEISLMEAPCACNGTLKVSSTSFSFSISHVSILILL